MPDQDAIDDAQAIRDLTAAAIEELQSDNPLDALDYIEEAYDVAEAGGRESTAEGLEDTLAMVNDRADDAALDELKTIHTATETVLELAGVTIVA